MWPKWLKDLKLVSKPVKIYSAPASPSSFSCSSFRDVQTLLNEEDASLSRHHHSKKLSLFRRMKVSFNTLRVWANRHPASPPYITIPDGCDRVVVYHTSLRIVHRTYEDCRVVRSILHGFCVDVDERDVTMDARLIEELKGIKGIKDISKLPFVFIDGTYVGGVEEIKQLFESGELEELITMLPKVQLRVCDLCRGLKFMVCGDCDGRHKIYSTHLGFVQCDACNVNGMVPCPSCSPRLLRIRSM